MRAMMQRNRQHFRGHRHLKIQRAATLAQHRGEMLDIGIRDMAAIFAQVRGDPVSAGLKRNNSRARGIGIGNTAGISDGGDVINVHAKPHAIAHSVLSDRASSDAHRRA